MMGNNMYMRVNLENCTGCGSCVDICPVEAISLLNEKAHIDPNICTKCEACIKACPNEAIERVQLPVQVPQEAQPQVEIIKPTIISPQPTRKIAPWAETALSFIGYEVAPRVINALLDAWERRLSSPSYPTRLKVRETPSTFIGGRRRARRRRKRHGLR